jgi:hypothetical protein
MWFAIFIFLVVISILNFIGDCYDKYPSKRESISNGCLISGLIFVFVIVILFSFSMSY